MKSYGKYFWQGSTESFLRWYHETVMMRRSSRIQIKQEGNVADSKSEVSHSNRLVPRPSRLPLRTIKVLSPKRPIGHKNGPHSTKSVPKKQTKSSQHQNKNGGTRVKTCSRSNSTSFLAAASKPKRSSEEPQRISTGICPENPNDEPTICSKTVKNDLSISLLIQEDSNDSILSDVANSLKIDRTIKNLSPKKFFHNKDPKTTRSGRSFSPYDFASYTALFGSICANQTNKTKPEHKSKVNPVKKDEFKQSKQPNKHNKYKKDRGHKRERLKVVKKPKKQYKKRVVIPPVEYEEFSEVEIDTGPVIKQEFVPTEIPYRRKVSDKFEDDLFSEEVPDFFWLNFPFPQFPMFEGHSFPLGIWDSIPPTPSSNWDSDIRNWCEPKRLDPNEMAALSKVSLADAEKYEFKSVFKDVSSQVEKFEDSCGEWKPSPAYGKFDVMEVETAEGRRFYRKRITDTRLIAWHKYNLASSTRYCPETDLPTTRPVIKVRSNQCHKADLVWRLNQTQPPPSIEEVLNGPVVTHPDPRHPKK